MVFKPRVFDGEPKSPASITRELLHNSPKLFVDLSDYCLEVAIQLGEDEVWKLPIGLQRVWRVADLYYKIANAGLSGYFGDRTDDNDCLIGGEELMTALHVFGADDVADVIEHAWSVWQVYLLATQPYSWKDPQGKQRKTEPLEKVGADIAPYLQRYYLLEDDLFKRIESYARAHEDEFLHSFD